MTPRIGVLIAAFAVAVFAQAPESAKTTIAGTVVNAVSGEPIAGALVTGQVFPRFEPGQVQPPPSPSLRAVTDVSGRFSFETEGSGGTLQVARQGYYSENNLGTAVVPVPQDGSSSITVRLWPASVITGRVLSSDGEPILGITVDAVKVEVANGRREFRENYATGTTDDRGEYRLWHLAPGAYYVKAAGRTLMKMFIAGNAAFDLADEAFVPVYYPSAATRQEAQLIQLKGGQTINAPFSLESRPAFQIRGKIANLPAQRALNSVCGAGAILLPIGPQ